VPVRSARAGAFWLTGNLAGARRETELADDAAGCCDVWTGAARLCAGLGCPFEAGMALLGSVGGPRCPPNSHRTTAAYDADARLGSFARRE
jgi:hypothetical protein